MRRRVVGFHEDDDQSSDHHLELHGAVELEVDFLRLEARDRGAPGSEPVDADGV